MLREICLKSIITFITFILICLLLSDIIFYMNFMSIKCSVELSNNLINNIVKFILENCFATSIVAFILIWINLASFFLTDNLCNMKDIHI